MRSLYSSTFDRLGAVDARRVFSSRAAIRSALCAAAVWALLLAIALGNREASRQLLHRGVNALAEDQTLKFGPNLTVIYGDNAAGKAGYIRILKSACRARGQEQVLGKVVSGATPLSRVVSIK